MWITRYVAQQHSRCQGIAPGLLRFERLCFFIIADTPLALQSQQEREWCAVVKTYRVTRIHVCAMPNITCWYSRNYACCRWYMQTTDTTYTHMSACTSDNTRSFANTSKLHLALRKHVWSSAVQIIRKQKACN